MNQYNPVEMFNSIKSSLAKQDKSSNRKDYLKTEVGNTYIVRLLPNVKDPTKTFFHYFTHSWKSFADGSNTLVTSRATWGERDPIAEQRFQISRNGTEAEKEKIKAIRRNENWLVAVYVVNDPVTPDNNGKTKVLRIGKQLKKIVDSAIDGEESEEFGPRIFDLSANGCNFKIKVEQQGDFPSYTSSRFQTAKEIEGMTDEKANEILNNVPNLENYITAKSYDELKQVFDEHYSCKVSSNSQTPTTTADLARMDGVTVDDPEIQKLLENIDK
jgi:hypothetical protein